jgi:hypothetical protein
VRPNTPRQGRDRRHSRYILSCFPCQETKHTATMRYLNGIPHFTNQGLQELLAAVSRDVAFLSSSRHVKGVSDEYVIRATKVTSQNPGRTMHTVFSLYLRRFHSTIYGSLSHRWRIGPQICFLLHTLRTSNGHITIIPNTTAPTHHLPFPYPTD